MSYATLGTLENWLTDFDKTPFIPCEREKLQIVSHLFAGMLLMHNANIVHRDIKPDNIFISVGFTILFGDFSVAEILDYESRCLHEYTGTQG